MSGDGTGQGTAAGYPVPAARARTELRDRGSRFVATADRARSADAARSIVEAVRAEMPDASHQCYAFSAGHGASTTQGMSDDGEPSGTAGRPILAVVAGSGIGDLIIVVTRYFGGTKLGTGGLVRAYTKAAQAVLGVLPIEIAIERVTAHLVVPYPLHDAVRRLLDARGVEVLHSEFDADVRLVLRLAATVAPDVERSLGEISSGALTLEDVEAAEE